jgi:hypothetical protein
MTDDYGDDLRAQLALEDRLPGFWQVNRTRRDRQVNGTLVPADWYYAVTWRLDEPPAVGASLDELERAVHARPVPQRSVMAELLGPEQARRFQTGPGRWYLPGPPP